MPPYGSSDEEVTAAGADLATIEDAQTVHEVPELIRAQGNPLSDEEVDVSQPSAGVRSLEAEI